MHWVKLWSLDGMAALTYSLFAIAPLVFWRQYLGGIGRLWAVATACTFVILALGYAASLNLLVQIGTYCFAANCFLLGVRTLRKPR